MKMSSLCNKGRGRAPAKGSVLDPKHRLKKGKKERKRQRKRKKEKRMDGRKKGRKKRK